MVSGGPSALPDNQRVSADGLAFPTRAGDDTDGLFVTNAGNERASLELLKRPAGVGGIASEQKQTNQGHSVCDPAVSAYKDVFSKTAMEGPGKSVSKVEAHADKVGKFGKFEGKGPNVGKSERSTWKVEGLGKTVGKSEEDAVGKAEQMGKSVGKSEGKNVGKAHRTEGENVGKSVGKADDESVGKLGKNNETVKVVAKVEGDVGTVTGKSVGKAAEGDVGKASDKSVGRGEEDDVEKLSQRSLGHEVGKARGNVQKQTMGTISNTKKSVLCSLPFVEEL